MKWLTLSAIMTTEQTLAKLTFPLTDLAQAFGVDTRKLKARLSAAAIAPVHGRWTVGQAHMALAGVGSLEKLRHEKQLLTERQRRLAEIAIGEKEERLVDVDEFTKRYAVVYVEMIRLIERSSMSQDEKDSLRLAMSALHDEAAKEEK
jgi:hypothetical protein